MKNKYKQLTVIALVVLSSCAVGPKVPIWISTYQSTPNDAVVIFSTGSEKTSPSKSSGLELYTEENKRINKYIGIDNPFQTSHFEDHHGNIYSFKLKPGTYYVHVVSANPYYKIAHPRMTKFTLQPGEQTYLGEFYLVQHGITISDKSDRDFSLIQKSDPALDPTRIIKRIPELIIYN